MSQNKEFVINEFKLFTWISFIIIIIFFVALFSANPAFSSSAHFF